MEKETDTSDEGQDQAAMAVKIAEQNDRFRRTWGADFSVPGQIVMTRGVADLSPAAKAIIMQRVQRYDVFTEDNDPYGDHGFGAFEFEIGGNSYHIFWKIDLHEEFTFSRPFLSLQRWFGSSNMLTPVASTCIRWACSPNQISVHVPGMEPPWLGPNFYRVCEDHQSSRSLNHPALRVILKFQCPILHLRLQNRARRDKSRFHVSPQGYDELAGKSHDGDFLFHPRAFSGVFPEPARKGALWLIPQPAPCQFDAEGSRRSVSGLADTLASLDVATGIRAGCQTQIRRQVSPVLELPAEHFSRQEHRTVSSNTAKPFKQNGLFVFGKLFRFSRKGFVAFLCQSLDHVVRQLQAFEGTDDLAHQLRWERAAISSLEAFQSPAPCHHRRVDVPNAVKGEQGTNAIDVASALAHQPFAFSVEALGIFFGNSRNTHRAECLSIAGAIVLQQNDHAFGVDAIRFDPPRFAVHEEAGGIHNQGLNPFVRQQSLKPKTVVSSLKANNRALIRPAKLRRLRNSRSNQIDQSRRVKPVQTHGLGLGQMRRIKRNQPFRFAQINGDKAGRRNRWRHHLGNLLSFDCALNLSAKRDLLHGNFYDTDDSMGSDDPGNTAVTRRVLTIMHASEY